MRPVAYALGAAVLAFGIAAAASHRAAGRLALPPVQSTTVEAAPPPAWSSGGRELLTTRCQVCHALDLITSQHLAPAEWAAEIAKMRRWGARLDEDEAALLAQELTIRVGADTPDRAPGALDARDVVTLDAPQPLPWPEGSSPRGAALFQESCAPCHGADARGGTGEVRGPALAGRAIVDWPHDFEAMVREGRGGMPGFGAGLGAGAMADLFAWIAAR